MRPEQENVNVPAPDGNARPSTRAAETATSALRRLSVKLAHPDDRCVRARPDGSGHLTCTCSLLFDDRPGLGDLIALGTPAVRRQVVFEEDEDGVERVIEGYRIVRVTEASWMPTDSGVSRDYAFEPTHMTWPAGKGRWWQRLLRRGVRHPAG